MVQYVKIIEQEAEKDKKLDEELTKNTPESSQSTLSGSQQFLGEPHIQTDVDIAMEEVEGAMQVAKDVEIDLEILLRTFNKGQKTIFDEITIELEMSFAHAAGDCQCTGNHQILRYISGEAGTGKSYLIRALRAYLQEKTKQVNCCVVAAPTGIAAFNVNGVTLHRLLMLPVEQEQRLEYNKLNPDAAQSIGRVMREVKLLIIDEISMVSNLMLAFVHLRLQEVLRSPRTIPFGGMHIVVFGDLLQLTPVKGQPVFRTLSSKDAHNAIGSIGNVNLWRYFKYYELEENMRQAGDLEYSQMLEGIRRGILTEVVKTSLETRLVSNMFPEGCSGEQLMSRLQNDGMETVALMPKTAQCDTFNLNMMKMEKNEIIIIDSNDSLDGETIPLNLDQKVQKRLTDMESKVSNTAGLDRKLKLCINCRVMLRRNLNVEMGLVNGAMGRIVSFQRDRTGSYYSVKVQFDKLTNPSLIGRVTARFKLFKDVYVRRSQFPLCAAYAITVHKSQGLSLDSAIVSIGKDVFKEGIVYVALSRVRQLSGLYILDFKPSEVKADTSCLVEYNRLRTEFGPHLKLFDVPSKIDKRKRQQPKDKEKEDSEVPQEKKQKIEDKKEKFHQLQSGISGLINPTKIECYCNSSLQLLFEIQSLMKIIKIHEQKQICEALILIQQCLVESGGQPVHASAIRHIVANLSGEGKFNRHIQHDAHEFLNYMFTVLVNQDIPVNDCIGISYQWYVHCQFCKKITTEEEQSNFSLMLGLPELSSVEFRNLIENVERGAFCSVCGRKEKSSLKILNSKQYILLMLERAGDSGKKNNVEIKNFKYAQMSIAGKTYRTQAFITHIGEELTSGHYITWKHQGQQWLKCDDSKITTEPRAPYSLKNIYVVLLLRAGKEASVISNVDETSYMKPTIRSQIDMDIQNSTLQTPQIKSHRKRPRKQDKVAVTSKNIPELKKIKLAVQIEYTEHHAEEMSGFLNESGVECYSNASLQFIFEIHSLMENIEKQEQQELCAVLMELQQAVVIRNEKPISAESVRHTVASASGNSVFSTQSQQDAQEFLITMFTVLQKENVSVHSSIGITYQWEHKCCSCSSIKKYPAETGLFLMLALPNCDSINFNDIVQNVKGEMMCTVCNSNSVSSLTKLDCQDYVILMLGIYHDDGRKKDVKITKFKHAQVSLAGRTYHTKAIIIHKGTSISSGHYITWKRRNNYWLQYDDGKISKEMRAPPYLKDVYLILLQKSFK